MQKTPPRITYLARSFLDYRIPVFQALDSMLEGRLSVLYSAVWTPPRVQQKAAAALGERAIALSGEKRIGDGRASKEMANAKLCIAYQPGLLKALAQTRPDVVISDGFFKWTFFAILHKLRHRVPVVVCYERTFHTERGAQWYRRLYRRAAVKLVDAVCCNGRLSAEYTRWLGVPEGRIVTGHMAADTDALRRQAERVPPHVRNALRAQLGVEGLALVYVGQLIRRKGVRELLEGWRLLEHSDPRAATLLIVGEGGEEQELRALAGQLGLQSVRFLGRVKYDEIARYYAASDAFVMPTLEDNWSLVVPEAMACGLPVLCSQYNGCWPELIDPGSNGWVFDPLNRDDVHRVLKLSVEHRDRLRQMGGRSKEIVSRHSPCTAAESIVRACEIAMTRRRKKGLTA